MPQSTLTPAVRIRRATPEDANVCGRICYEAFAAINARTASRLIFLHPKWA
jgi:hypothetical protein